MTYTNLKDFNPIIIIPCGGAGKRFKDAGFTEPKYLISVAGVTMLDRVQMNLGSYIFGKDNFHYVVVDDKVNKPCIMNTVGNPATTVFLPHMTRGAAETVSYAVGALIGADKKNAMRPLVIANCDQIEEWNMYAFYEQVINGDDGVVVVTEDHIEPILEDVIPDAVALKTAFKERGDQWLPAQKKLLGYSHTLNNWQNYSYVHVDHLGYVDDCIEKPKKELSVTYHPTTGIYAWKYAGMFLECSAAIIDRNARSGNGEFYVCPVYNEAIKYGAKISTFKVFKHHSLGTPEELDSYVEYIKNQKDQNESI